MGLVWEGRGGEGQGPYLQCPGISQTPWLHLTWSVPLATRQCRMESGWMRVWVSVGVSVGGAPCPTSRLPLSWAAPRDQSQTHSVFPSADSSEMTSQNEISLPLLPRQPPRACGEGAVHSPSQSPGCGGGGGQAGPAALAHPEGTHGPWERHGWEGALQLLVHRSPPAPHSVQGRCYQQHALAAPYPLQGGLHGDSRLLCDKREKGAATVGKACCRTLWCCLCQGTSIVLCCITGKPQPHSQDLRLVNCFEQRIA